ncbi:MAG: 2-C-methyl-D-erythritol 4-phosphate cytidylyltransferase [Bacilli bacterium]|nr:2-C-methyl-D-erythritol 4-phosphate cytidylyltransferase [Bacilli bacterium]
MCNSAGNKVIGVILMGGSGVRFGGDTPKQYVMARGQELFLHVAKAFESNEIIDEVVFVAKIDYFPLIGQILNRVGYSKKYSYAISGETREESAYNAIKAISEKEDKNTIVLITDADRPHSGKYITPMVKKIEEAGFAVVAFPVTDSLAVSMDGDRIVSYQDRSHAILLATPQGGRLFILKSAMDKAKDHLGDYTDEGSLVLNELHMAPAIVKGNSGNYKINTIDDMKRFEEESA